MVKLTITTLETITTTNEATTETGTEEVSSAELIRAVIEVEEAGADIFSEQIQIKTEIFVEKASKTFTKLSVSQIEQVEATRMRCVAVQAKIEESITEEKEKIETETGKTVNESEFLFIEEQVGTDEFIVDMVSLQRNKDAVVTGIEALTIIIQQFTVEIVTTVEITCGSFITLAEELLNLIKENDETVQEKAADVLKKVGSKVTGCSEENKNTITTLKTSFESKKVEIEIKVAIIEEDISLISEISISENIGLEELGVATVAPDGSAVAKDSLSLSVADEIETLIVVDIIQVVKKINAIEKSIAKIENVMTVTTTEATAMSSEKFLRLVIRLLELLISIKTDEDAEELQEITVIIVTSIVEVLTEEVKTSLTEYKTTLITSKPWKKV